MGLKSVLKWDPARAAKAWLSSPEEKARRQLAQSRRYLLQDNAQNEIKREIARLFTDATVKERTMMFAHLAQSVTLFRRVIAERVRPVYLISPVRSLKDPAGQDKFQRVVDETYLDAVAPRWLTAALGTGAAFAYPRYVQRLDRIVIDVIPACSVTVIPDPDDPCRELAVIYDKQVFTADGKSETWHVYWDDTITFQMDANDNVVPFEKGGDAYRPNTLGIIPFVAIHPYGRMGAYWNPTGGTSLVQANMPICALTALALRKLKARGFNQIVVTGDALRFPKGQAMDEESAILAPEGTDVHEIGTEADSANYLDMIEALENRAAAEFGISRARLNQDKVGDDTGLTEQRAEMVKLMAEAEHELFEVLKVVSGETTDRQIPADAEMSIDFGEYQFRADAEAELRVWREKRSQGVRNILDHIKSENPEIRTDEEAKAEAMRNLSTESWFIEERRALNMPEGASVTDPGQDPAANGAMGPAVRDGKLTKDQAAAMAVTGDTNVAEH
jgi:hypothetical protein